MVRSAQATASSGVLPPAERIVSANEDVVDLVDGEMAVDEMLDHADAPNIDCARDWYDEVGTRPETEMPMLSAWVIDESVEAIERSGATGAVTALSEFSAVTSSISVRRCEKEIEIDASSSSESCDSVPDLDTELDGLDATPDATLLINEAETISCGTDSYS